MFFKAILTALVAVLSVCAPADASHHHHHTTAVVDKSPGVVTLWEFNHLQVGMTRAEVRDLYGVSGTEENWWWGSDGNFYLALAYPTVDGGVTDVIYVERANGYRTRYWNWYAPDGTILYEGGNR